MQRRCSAQFLTWIALVFSQNSWPYENFFIAIEIISPPITEFSCQSFFLSGIRVVLLRTDTVALDVSINLTFELIRDDYGAAGARLGQKQ